MRDDKILRFLVRIPIGKAREYVAGGRKIVQHFDEEEIGAPSRGLLKADLERRGVQGYEIWCTGSMRIIWSPIAGAE